MTTISDNIQNAQRPSREAVSQVRPVATAAPTGYHTDTLRRQSAPPAPIAYGATVDGVPAQAMLAKLHGHVHQHASHLTPINDAQLRVAVGQLCEHAANVKDERDLAKLGHQAQDLLDRVNASSASDLSDAARASAARAVVPLAQAGEFTDLLSQAQGMLGAISPSTRREAAAFMVNHGASVHEQIHGLHLSPAAHALLERKYEQVHQAALSLWYATQINQAQSEDEARHKAESSAWYSWLQKLAERKSQERLDEARAADCLG